MRNYHKQLVESKHDKTVGNHSVQHFNHSRYFYYHGNNVCTVDDENKTYELSFCGWYTISTKHCLAGYRQYFSNIGYTQINQIPIYNSEEVK